MFNYLLYRAGQFIALYLPLKIGYALAVSLARAQCFFSVADRRAVKNNLRAIFPDYPESTIRRLSVGTFENFAKYLVDFFRFQILDKEYVARNVKGPVICGLARSIEKDIDAAYNAVKYAGRARIHVFLATSKIHMKYKLQKAEDEILRLAVSGVKYARKFLTSVTWT